MRLASILTAMVIIVGAATPALAQSAETCVKYMEADSAYIKYRSAAQNTYDESTKKIWKILNDAYKIYEKTERKLLKKRFAVLGIATDRRDAIIGQAEKRRIKQIRAGKPTLDIREKQFEIAK